MGKHVTRLGNHDIEKEPAYACQEIHLEHSSLKRRELSSPWIEHQHWGNDVKYNQQAREQSEKQAVKRCCPVELQQSI